MQALKVTISGSYNTSTRDVIDFDNISGIVPFVSDAKVKQYVRKRYAYEWVRTARTKDGKVLPYGSKEGDLLFKERISQMRQTFIDDIVPIEHDFTYIDKNIKEMSYEELTDLATANDLLAVPLPKGLSGVDLREMRICAYIEYSGKVAGRPINRQAPPQEYADETEDREGNQRLTFSFAKLPPLIAGGGVHVNHGAGRTNDEVIAQEMKPTSLTGGGEGKPTFEELKAMAASQGITLHHRNTYESLYQKIYGRLPDGVTA